jgi:hypothetical protein
MAARGKKIFRGDARFSHTSSPPLQSRGVMSCPCPYHAFCHFAGERTDLDGIAVAATRGAAVGARPRGGRRRGGFPSGEGSHLTWPPVDFPAPAGGKEVAERGHLWSPETLVAIPHHRYPAC